jgi:uncharacterized membrane protein
MSDQPHADVHALQVEVNRLTRRLSALEQTVLEIQGAPLGPQAYVESEPDFVEPPPAPAPAPVAAPPRRRPAPPPQPQVQIDWSKIAARLFTAATLAWAGGIATALGVVLLFVMAASRGWVTAPMRVGVGLAVSLVMLAAAIELDRRRWRADAILAAAGVGVAGLYTTLWASTWLYHFVAAGVAAPLATVIAALAVAVAIRIRQEPLAVFGVVGAMLAPVLVSLSFTASGVLFAMIMMAATLPLHHRLHWRRLIAAGWLVGYFEAGALLIASARHTGFGPPVAAVFVAALLLVVMLFVVELLPPTRARVSGLGWLIASSAFTLSIGDVFLYAGERHVSGHSLAGLGLVAVMVAWALVAGVPVAVRRSHPDLTDILASFALTAAAAATGLLAGGPALVCAWAAESAVLVVAAERIARRGSGRQVRITIASAVYLGLGTLAALRVLVPVARHMTHLGAGTSAGTIALTAVAIAGVVFCYGTRWVARPERAALWTLPAVAIGALPAWALGPEWAVVAYAALAAALLCYRRSPFMIRWLRDEDAIVIAAAWWAVGAWAALAVTASLDDLLTASWGGLGEHHGLLGLIALTAAAGVFAWSIRRPQRPYVEYGLLVPLVSGAYLLAQVLTAPHAIWAWLIGAALLAGVVHVPVLRIRLTARPLIVGSAGLLGLGLASAWASDHSLHAIADHGVTRGWESIAIATVAALVLASAMADPRRRSLALWLPYALAALLAAMLLPGQYPLVAVAMLATLAGVATVVWPESLARRLARPVLLDMGVIGALGVAALVLIHYETPRMLFQSSHSPASGLAAAIAATAALFVAAFAARASMPGASRMIAGVRADTALVYLGGAAALWTLAAAILGAAELGAAVSAASVHDHFQQGHVLVSIGWVLVGLILVVLSLRGDRRAVRVGGIALLFVALGKLFLYDLAFLTAMARAVSFIVTGSLLLLAALLLQRFAPQVKAALSDDPPEVIA